MKKLSGFVWAGLIFACAFCCVNGVAAEGEPWELWRQAYNDQLQAEQLLRQGKKPEAKLMFIRARNSYVAVKDARPDWNQDLINSRIALCERESAELGDVETARSVTVPVLSREPEPSDEYKERYFKALMELDNMRKELDAAKSSTFEISALLSEKQELQAQYSLLLSQYQELKEAANTPSAELESLRTRLLEAQLIADNAVRRRNALEDNYEQLKNDYNSVVAAGKQLQEEKRTLQSRVADIEKEISQSRNNITAERKRTADMSLELQKREAEIAELKRNIRQLTEDNSTMINNLTGNKDIDAGLAEEIKKYKERYEQLERDYLSMNSENRQLSADLRELRLNMSDNSETIRNLDERNKSLQLKNDELAAANNDLEQKFKTADESSREFESRVAALGAENDDLHARNTSLELRLRNREEGQITISEEYQKEKKKLQSEVAELRLELVSLQGEVNGLKEKLETETDRNAELKNDYIDIKAAHMNLSLEMDKYKDIEQRCAQLESDLAAAVADNEAHIAKIAELEAGSRAVPVQVDLPVAPVVSGDDGGEKTAKYLSAARKAVNDGFLELAVLEYQRLLKTAPEHNEANWELGKLYLADGRPAEALGYLKKSCALEPDNIEFRKTYIAAAAAAGKKEEVLELYDSLPTELQQDGDMLHARGRALAMLNRWEEAEKIYELPLLADAAGPQMLLEYTRILVALDKNDIAAEVYNRARNAGAAADVSIESALGMKLDANRDLCEFFEAACNEAFAAGNWESVIWYSLKLVGMDAGNPEYYFDWAYAAIVLERGNEAGAALAQAAVRSNCGSRDRQMRLLLSGAAELLNEKPGDAAQAFREAAAVGAAAEDGLANVVVDERYADLPAVIRKLLKGISNQPSVSRQDIDSAVEAFAALGI